ncbi:MAG TPA: homocysteine S-methyltransferase family protein [Anaerolineae bacterium]|nr:homocysteine S-methyltransferase family protein [Anaerolineae bacterium]
MAYSFSDRLKAGEILVADGATGTNLQAVGLPPGTSPEEWVLDQPDRIRALQRSFVEAGSDLILTCTFGGTRIRLKESPYADRAAELNRRAVELAREAAGDRTLIGGSMGPLGSLLKPFGPIEYAEAVAAYAEQAQALSTGGVDVLVIETHFSLEEAQAAAEGARQVSQLPLVVSFSYDRGVRTMMGVKPAQVVEKFKSLDVTAIGANCGTTLENLEKIVQEYATAIAAAAPSGLFIWAKPNAGLPTVETATSRSVYGVTPEQMGEFAKRYVAIGARIVGGCCGSTPAHVKAIAQAVKG